jgi:predicted nicotinamide N-methyase
VTVPAQGGYGRPVTAGEPATFVREHTGLAAVPFVPELRIHQADDAIALWEETEARHGGPGLAPPFWAFPWAGGQALARYVLDNPSSVAGRSVCDIAAGSGLVALAAARAGAARVHAVEIDPYAIAAIVMNAAANGLTVTTLLADLLADASAAPGAEVLLAGDVFYSREMAARMLAFFRTARARGSDVLVGDPGRAYVPADALERLADYDVPVIRDLEDAEMRHATVWRLPVASTPFRA